VVAVRDSGKRNVAGVLIDAVDYEAVVHRTLRAARERRAFAVTALAVHGVMTGVRDPGYRSRLNSIEIVTPDGQPVRWALRLLHRVRLPDRVYGPQLMLDLCQGAAEEELPVYLYGSSDAVLDQLVPRLRHRVPGLSIAGAEPSKFRRTSLEERAQIATRIRDSGAHLTFVGLGCPRQEIFVHEYRDVLRMPAVAVGAAFDYHAGLLSEPPYLVQRMGLQWLMRLLQEPSRLWRRYVVLNPQYMVLVALQALRVWKPDTRTTDVSTEMQLVG
jgi:N-acetylglucosaminyldiphosphoundecaprenol N-acetyl-beta-D-mannosaminyltransferase